MAGRYTSKCVMTSLIVSCLFFPLGVVPEAAEHVAVGLAASAHGRLCHQGAAL